MQPFHWHPSVALSAQEEQIVQKIRRAKVFVFLRHQRHALFNESFQQELATLYKPSKRGHPPIAPAQLALAVILQAYTGVSDDEVIEATLMDRRWQLVLDCLDTDQAPFSKRDAGGFSPAVHQRTDGSATDRASHRSGEPKPGIWTTRLACRPGQQPTVGGRGSRR